MAFYENLRDTVVTPLLTEFGMSITLTRIETPENNPAFDPVEGEFIGDPTPTEYTGNGLLFDFNVDDKNNGFSLTAGVTTQEGDKLLKCIGIPAPVTTDRIIAASAEYKIMAIGKVSPAGVDLIYNLQLRSWEPGI